jgi:hypothetical protein
MQFVQTDAYFCLYKIRVSIHMKAACVYAGHYKLSSVSSDTYFIKTEHKFTETVNKNTCEHIWHCNVTNEFYTLMPTLKHFHYITLKESLILLMLNSGCMIITFMNCKCVTGYCHCQVPTLWTATLNQTILSVWISLLSVGSKLKLWWYF